MRHSDLKHFRRSAIPTTRSTVLYGVFVLVLSVVACWVSTFLTESSLRQFIEIRRLEASGVVAQAIVTDLYTYSGSRGETLRGVVYQFDARFPNGELRSLMKREQVGPDVYESTVIGNPVTIIYVAGDPTISRIVLQYYLERSFPRIDRLFTGIVIGFLGLLAIIILGGSAWVRFQAARELDRHGSVVQGTIIKLWEERYWRERWCCVAFEFGDGFRAAEVVQRLIFDKLHIGDEVTVRFLPRDPAVFRLEENWKHKRG